ncbi:MAG TPA: hypothetical protein VMH35_28560 [Streptosporangiaceae bacterium]|nr:hypothetical protein [Streptosporangiaceae bacterium]
MSQAAAGAAVRRPGDGSQPELAARAARTRTAAGPAHAAELAAVLDGQALPAFSGGAALDEAGLAGRYGRLAQRRSRDGSQQCGNG